MKHAYLILDYALSVLIISSSIVAQPIKVIGGHPRIYITKETLPEIQKGCKTTHQEIYKKILATDWIMKRPAKVDWSDVTNINMPVFLYAVTGEEKYLRKAKEFLNAMSENPPRNQYLTPEYIRAGSMAYDWCYHGLTESERERFGKTLLEMCDYMLGLWRHSDFNNHFVNERLAILYAGVALDGDGIDDERAGRLLNEGAKLLRDHAIPAANEIAGEDGGQAEGFSYNNWGYARPLALTTEMWRVATGEDLFRGSSFFANQALWNVYCRRPHDGAQERAEDCPSGHRWGENLKSFIHLLATRYQDGLAEWVGQQIPRKYAQSGWKEMLWQSPEIKPTPPTDLPLARHFRKLGWVVMRSGWGDSDDTFALFQCGDFYAGHQHLDANSFVIHKMGSLAIDSGVNEYSSHRANYYSRAIAHNTITVFDPQEKFSGAVWGPQGDDKGSNDGGQLRRSAITRVGTFQVGGKNDIADIIAFKNGEFFAYVAGDASRCYSDRKLKTFVRQFVHLRPDLFVVFDRVVSTRPEFAKRWLLHSINQPEIKGDTFTLTHESGRLTGRVLLPTKRKIELVGGKGKEFWVNGRNYPPNSKKDPEAGAWRIELSPSENKTKTEFLVILLASPKKERPTPQGKLITEDGWTGAKIAYREMSYEIKFATEGDVAARISVRRSAEEPIEVEEITGRL